MSEELIEGRQKQLRENLKASIHKAEGLVNGSQKANTRLLSTTIVSSAAATLVAGVTAAIGPVVGEGTEGWRMACIVAAVFGFVSTVSTGMTRGDRQDLPGLDGVIRPALTPTPATTRLPVRFSGSPGRCTSRPGRRSHVRTPRSGGIR